MKAAVSRAAKWADFGARNGLPLPHGLYDIETDCVWDADSERWTQETGRALDFAVDTDWRQWILGRSRVWAMRVPTPLECASLQHFLSAFSSQLSAIS